MKSASELTKALHQFTGTAKYHRYSALFPNTLLTDGAHYLAENAECYWLMDIIGSIESEMKDHYFLNIVFKKEGKGGKFTVDDGNGNVIYTQDIELTDFPLEEIQLYGIRDEIHRIVMLTSEY